MERSELWDWNEEIQNALNPKPDRYQTVLSEHQTQLLVALMLSEIAMKLDDIIELAEAGKLLHR